MIVYLMNKNDYVGKGTKLLAYNIDVKEFGTFRKTLVIGDIVNLNGKLVEIYDYNYSNVHNKGFYTYTKYTKKVNRVIRSEIDDVLA